MIKRFMLFMGDDYYPAGGGDDFTASFDTKEEAIQHAKQLGYPRKYDWAHVIDLTTGEMERLP
jgi:hypothetical protein